MKLLYQGYYLLLALPVHHVENVRSVSAGDSDHHKSTTALLQAADIRNRLKKRCDLSKAKGLVGQALADLHILRDLLMFIRLNLLILLNSAIHRTSPEFVLEIRI